MRPAARQTDPARKPRLQALWLMRTGLRMVEVAAHVGFTYRAVHKWLEAPSTFWTVPSA